MSAEIDSDTCSAVLGCDGEGGIVFHVFCHRNPDPDDLQAVKDQMATFWFERVSREEPGEPGLSVVHPRSYPGSLNGLSALRMVREQPPLIGASSAKLPDAAYLQLFAIARDLRDSRERERTDPLTGLLNRRGFEERLERHVEFCARYRETAGLLLLDLDGLKAVNDQEGYGAGDELLRAAASGLRTVLRASDDLARYGGDEFAALLPRADRNGLAAAAARAVSRDAGFTLSAGGVLIDGRVGWVKLIDEAWTRVRSAKRRGGGAWECGEEPPA